MIAIINFHFIPPLYLNYSEWSVAGEVGFEPTTSRLTAGRSTTEPYANIFTIKKESFYLLKQLERFLKKSYYDVKVPVFNIGICAEYTLHL